MSKLAVILAIYAAVVGTMLLLDRGDSGPAAPQTQQEPAGSEDVRTMLAEVRALWREELKGTLKNVNWRFAERDALRKSMVEGLQATQASSEGSAQANYGMLETIKEDVERFGTATKHVEKLVGRLVAIEARLKAVEDRPAQIIKERVISGPGTARPDPTAPKGRVLPTKRKKDPAIVAKEVAEARKGLASEDVDELFAAIEKIREHKVMDAVPRLLVILKSFKDEFGRTAAASALGDMRVADAVLPLAEALVDKSDLVASQANKAISQITDYETGLSPTARIKSRRTARNKVKEWWRDHEAEVRARLKQPGTAGG